MKHSSNFKRWAFVILNPLPLDSFTPSGLKCIDNIINPNPLLHISAQWFETLASLENVGLKWSNQLFGDRRKINNFLFRTRTLCLPLGILYTPPHLRKMDLIRCQILRYLSISYNRQQYQIGYIFLIFLHLAFCHVGHQCFLHFRIKEENITAYLQLIHNLSTAYLPPAYSYIQLATLETYHQFQFHNPFSFFSISALNDSKLFEIAFSSIFSSIVWIFACHFICLFISNISIVFLKGVQYKIINKRVNNPKLWSGSQFEVYPKPLWVSAPDPRYNRTAVPPTPEV